MKTQARRWYSALAFLGMAGVAIAHAAAPPATGTIEGTATLAGRPLAGARCTAGNAASTSGADGRFTLAAVAAGRQTVRCERAGLQPGSASVDVPAGGTARVTVALTAAAEEAEKRRETTRDLPAAAYEDAPTSLDGRLQGHGGSPARPAPRPTRSVPAAPAPRVALALPADPVAHLRAPGEAPNTEGYDPLGENPFHDPKRVPLSTFSIDVDTASFSNVRRFLDQQGRRPPPDAVRIEELVNYFPYDYPEPTGEHPFSVTTDVTHTPWNPDRLLVRIGLQGRRIPVQKLPPSNLVFLIDVSGSMNLPNKLPLLKQAFRLLVANLRPQDTVAMVVYAGAAGVVLPPTPGKQKETILAALDQLSAGGSTAGAAGIRLAYQVARKHLIRGGNNRVVLATDGDFNVGVSSDGELVRMIEEERKSGVFLTVLGFGMGNYKDGRLEKLSNAGNGNAAYIDTLHEARKVLVTEMGATLLTIAKDVKLQVEFNPALVQSYRLIGYENRVLADRDFDDDKKDAGDLGAGHSVTAFYEIVPVGGLEAADIPAPLKYQATVTTPAAETDELMTVKLRYKRPDSDTSTLLSTTVPARSTPLAKAAEDVRFAASVVEWGLILRDSAHKSGASIDGALARARGALGEDPHGYRAELVRLIERSASLR